MEIPALILAFGLLVIPLCSIIVWSIQDCNRIKRKEQEEKEFRETLLEKIKDLDTHLYCINGNLTSLMEYEEKKDHEI